MLDKVTIERDYYGAREELFMKRMHKAEEALLDEQKKTGTCTRPDCEKLKRDLARANTDIRYYRKQLLIPEIPEREIKKQGY